MTRSVHGALYGLILLISIPARAQAQCIGILRVDTAGVGHLPACDLLPPRRPPPAPDTALYRIVARVIVDSLREGGTADLQHLYGLGRWAVFQRAGAPVLEDPLVRCPTAAGSTATAVGHNINAHMFPDLDREAWILYVSKSCVRPRPGTDDETVREKVAWLIEWTGVAWRLGPRFVGLR